MKQTTFTVIAALLLLVVLIGCTPQTPVAPSPSAQLPSTANVKDTNTQIANTAPPKVAQNLNADWKLPTVSKITGGNGAASCGTGPAVGYDGWVEGKQPIPNEPLLTIQIQDSCGYLWIDHIDGSSFYEHIVSPDGTVRSRHSVTGATLHQKLVDIIDQMPPLQSEYNLTPDDGTAVAGGGKNIWTITFKKGNNQVSTVVMRVDGGAFPPELTPLNAWFTALSKKVQRDNMNPSDVAIFSVEHTEMKNEKTLRDEKFNVMNDGSIKYLNMTADAKSVQLTADEQKEFAQLISALGTLQPRYGTTTSTRTWGTSPASASIYVLQNEEEMNTVISPDVSANYPPELKQVVDWVEQKFSTANAGR